MTRASLCVLTVLLAIPGCSKEPLRPRGVVLFLLDTVRPDRLSCYGNRRPTSPAIDALAARGARFEQVVSFAPWTLPSIAALLSGEPANVAFQGTLKQSLIEDLERAGVRAAAITENGWFAAKYGVDRGFDEFVEDSPFREDDQLGKAGVGRTFKRAREWLEDHVRTRGDQPFFLLVHSYEPHVPYARRTFTKGLSPGRVGEFFGMASLDQLHRGLVEYDDDDLEFLEALYDGGIHEADRHVGAFVERLEAMDLAGDVVVGVTSDHGEDLGDHYRQRSGDHGHSLLDDLMLVPLVIADPTGTLPAGVIENQIRTLDILPTVLELLGVEVPPDIAGRSLIPLARGESEGPRIAFGGSTHTGPDRTFIRHLGYKFIETIGPDSHQPPLDPAPPRVQLFDLRLDPGEVDNLAEQRPELVERFRELNRRIDRQGAGSIEIDPADAELAARLKELGYLK